MFLANGHRYRHWYGSGSEAYGLGPCDCSCERGGMQGGEAKPATACRPIPRTHDFKAAATRTTTANSQQQNIYFNSHPSCSFNPLSVNQFLLNHFWRYLPVRELFDEPWMQKLNAQLQSVTLQVQSVLLRSSIQPPCSSSVCLDPCLSPTQPAERQTCSRRAVMNHEPRFRD